jgi:hypothetical protein
LKFGCDTLTGAQGSQRTMDGGVVIVTVAHSLVPTTSSVSRTSS